MLFKNDYEKITFLTTAANNIEEIFRLVPSYLSKIANNKNYPDLEGRVKNFLYNYDIGSVL